MRTADQTPAFQPPPALFRLRPWRAAASLLSDWLLIAASFALAVRWPSPAAYLLAAVLIARTQLALAVMMHESAHGLLHPVRRANDLLGQFLAAGPLYLSLKTYRFGHLQHHRDPMSADDPVAVVFEVGDYPIPRRALAGRLLRDLCGLGYLGSVRHAIAGTHRALFAPLRKSQADKAVEALSMLLSQAALLGALWLAGHPWLYPGLWLLPAMTLLPAMGRVRAIMEHAGYPQGADQRRNARTIVRPSWQTFLFGPHAIHYHIEHHQHVRVPFYHLPAMHAAMAQAQQLPAANLYTGYGRILRDVSY